jgi:hypothetical protein
VLGRQAICAAGMEWSCVVWDHWNDWQKNDLATSTKDRWSIMMETPYAQISILDNEWSHLHGHII